MSAGFFTRDLGIDLGTANTLVYAAKQGIALREPSVVAVRYDEKSKVLAVGDKARQMIGRTPGNVVAAKPVNRGVITDTENAEILLKSCLRKVTGISPLVRARVILGMPCGISNAEKNIAYETLRLSGVKQCVIAEKPMLAGIGAELPVDAPRGSMVVDIGAGITEVAVLSLGGIVTSTSVPLGGNALDDAIVEYVKRRYNLLIAVSTAEEAKIGLGAAIPYPEDEVARVLGKNLVTGMPETIEIYGNEISGALRAPLASVITAIKSALEHTPPELAGDIMQRGICLTGGGALLRDLPALVQQETGMPVYVSKNPQECVVTGAGHMAEDSEVWRKAVRFGAIED